jgi:hypothetical protein
MPPSVPAPPSAAAPSQRPSRRRSRRARLHCPACSGTVRRVRRAPIERLLSAPLAHVGRYRCRDRACGWSGWLARKGGASGWRLARTLSPALMVFGGSVLTVALFGAGMWAHHREPLRPVAVGPHWFPVGAVHDGDPLPSAHTLLKTSSELHPDDEGPPKAPHPPSAAPNAPPSAVATAATAVPAAARAPGTVAGLSLRRFCSWGEPGRLPYQGTVDQALRAAQVPQEVRQQIVAAVAAGAASERVEIANEVIRGAASGRQWSSGSFAMTYGHTLCLGTRVNFPRGHTESASLYEASDRRGRRYSVMLPDVCGNVSLITPVALSDEAIHEPWHPGPVDSRNARPEDSHAVPSPGTLGLSLLALLGMLAGRAAAGRSRR